MAVWKGGRDLMFGFEGIINGLIICLCVTLFVNLQIRFFILALYEIIILFPVK